MCTGLHGRLGISAEPVLFVPLDEAHAHNAAAYVELNPVRAGVVRHAWDYAWSSAKCHCGRTGDPSGLLALRAWFEGMPVEEWKSALKAIADSDGTIEQLREYTRRVYR